MSNQSRQDDDIEVAALAFCNQVRGKRGHKPCRRLVQGVRYVADKCPISQTISVGQPEEVTTTPVAKHYAGYPAGFVDKMTAEVFVKEAGDPVKYETADVKVRVFINTFDRGLRPHLERSSHEEAN